MTKSARKILRIGGVLLCEAFTLFTVVLMLVRQEYGRLPLALATIVLVLLPSVAERLLRWHFPLPMYLTCLVYSIGPMLGQCHKFYYLFPCWDKLLHVTAGVLFAIFGYILFHRLGGTEKTRLLAGLFALLFSMGISVCWEFVEFGADRLLGCDMQDDMIVTSIHSYALGEELGVIGSIDEVQSVTINGTPLPFEGYLDIGLTDTMLDMLLETGGALLTVLALSFRKRPLQLTAEV